MGEQVRINRARPEYMLVHGQGFERSVAVTHLDCGSAFSRMPHTRVVARAADRDR